jgi:outer membrane protein OmpA-like peptidoglycan-associated protein
MKYIKFFLTIFLIVAFTHTSEAQLWKKLKQHAEEKIKSEAERRAERRIDKGIDKVYDETEDEIDGKHKKSKKKKSKNASQNNDDEQEVSKQSKTKKAKKEKTHKLVWNRFDFVPGDTVIFEDKPDNDEEVGEFPSRWDLYKGSTEIGEMDGENVIMFIEGGSSIIPYLKNSKEDYMPDIFTIEMDVWFPKRTSTSNRLYIYLGDKKNNNTPAAHEYLTVMPHSLAFGESEKSYPGTENTGWSVEKTGSWRHISIAYTKGKYKAYFNDVRLINIPHLEVNPTGLTIASSGDEIYIKNIRIAKGGVKYYKRVLSDGKIIVNGIKFDVNKATLKPESMGPINRIYKLMKKQPGLKFSVEGHTDSDGDEAFNLELSKRRAKTVMDKLISMGIDASRLKYTGWGESKPIDNNATPEGKANNRRVEFVKF